MHELAVCQDLLRQVQQIAADNGASCVDQVTLRIGALSGVEAPLLQRAFTVARAGGVAESAELLIETGPVRVRCRSCGANNEVAPNRLLCAACHDWQVDVISGEELLLMRVALSGVAPVVEKQRRHQHV
jgi:hydrogenase nickel incorporation protein HypA/HybF